MFKSLLGNALFAGCFVAWYFYADGDRSLMLAGTILAFACFLSGIFMGYLLRGPGKVRRAEYRGPEQPVIAPTVAAAEFEHEAAEADDEPLELQPEIEPDSGEESETPIAIAVIVKPAEIGSAEVGVPVGDEDLVVRNDNPQVTIIPNTH